MTTLDTQVDNSVDFFILAAKECGFKTPEQIDQNFETIALVAAEMVKHSRERILTKLTSNPNLNHYLAGRYKLKVLQNN